MQAPDRGQRAFWPGAQALRLEAGNPKVYMAQPAEERDHDDTDTTIGLAPRTRQRHG